MPKGQKLINPGSNGCIIMCACGRKFKGTAKTIDKQHSMHLKATPACRNGIMKQTETLKFDANSNANNPLMIKSKITRNKFIDDLPNTFLENGKITNSVLEHFEKKSEKFYDF